MPELRKPVIQVEISGYCNLRCVMCYYPQMKRRKGYMTQDTFTKIIEGAKELNVTRLRLFVFGDPLLHPQLDLFLKLLQKNDIEADLSTNGMLLTPEIRKSIINNNVFRVIFSIDGSDQETYGSIRTGGDFWKVVSNVVALKQEIARANGETQMQVQTMIMDSTVSTINKTIDFWKTKKLPLSIQFVQTQAGTVPDFSAQNVPENIKIKTPSICSAPYNKVIVYWNGDLGFCCSDAEAEIAISSIHNETLLKFWTSYRSKILRQTFDSGDLNFCKKCNLYKYYQGS